MGCILSSLGHICPVFVGVGVEKMGVGGGRRDMYVPNGLLASGKKGAPRSSFPVFIMAWWVVSFGVRREWGGAGGDRRGMS